jgi:predicted TPR repeat methyltransferase
VDPAGFEARYRRDGDPWSFATSEYERAKYAHTVAALGDDRFGRALELGCSIGVLTRLLAPACDTLTAVDAAPTAVAAARERVADLSHVEAAVAVLPEELPRGPWDLVVASEVLYYFDLPLLGALLDALEAALLPGGTLLAVHYTGPAPDHRLTADAVHACLRGRETLEPVLEAEHPGYRLGRFRRR